MNQIELSLWNDNNWSEISFRFCHSICILSGLFNLKKIHLNQVQCTLWHHQRMMGMLSNLWNRFFSLIFFSIAEKSIRILWVCVVYSNLCITFDMYDTVTLGKSSSQTKWRSCVGNWFILSSHTWIWSKHIAIRIKAFFY